MLILQNIGAVLVLIGVMIMIHELGHYWAARFFDVKVDAFSFGFGPRLFGFRRGETDFRVSAIRLRSLAQKCSRHSASTLSFLTSTGAQAWQPQAGSGHASADRAAGRSQ